MTEGTGKGAGTGPPRTEEEERPASKEVAPKSKDRSRGMPYRRGREGQDEETEAGEGGGGKTAAGQGQGQATWPVDEANGCILAPPSVFPRHRGSKGYGGSPRGSKEVHVGAQRPLDHLLESLLLGLGLLHPLLGHLLEGLLLLLGQLHPLLRGLLEGLSRGSLPLLLRLLRDVEGRGVQELDVAAHLILHHLLEGLLLPRDLIAHGLHGGDPPASDLFRRLLSPADVVAHLSSLIGHLSVPRDTDIPTAG